MARSLSVKIPTASLIADIEASIAKIDADLANYPALVAEYRNAKAKHEEVVIKAVIEALGKPELIGTQYDSPIRLDYRYGNSVSVSVNGDLLGLPEAPVEPKKPNEREYYGREYTTRKDLLTRNLKVLKMTSQEEVNATTYNTVIDLL
jgi:hypothetical protein